MLLPNYPLGETVLGVDLNGKAVTCKDDAKHIFICGTTGSGKTVLLSNFAESAINKNYGMLAIDGKGDTGEGSMMDILQSLAQTFNRKLYVVSLSNPLHSAKYNPFANATETIAKDMIINMTDWSEEHYKTNTERFIQRLIKLMLIKGLNLSFTNILAYASCDKFESLSSLLVKENKLTKEEHILNLEISKASGKIAENAVARFATIAESEAGIIFDESGIDIFKALNENAIILFILNPLIYPELSPAMGRLILIDAKKAISKLFNGTMLRKFFIFDEINVYASTVLIDLINKARSASVTVIPATQSLADLEAAAGEAFKHQIIENCNNYIVLRQNSSKSAEEWSKILGTRETMEFTYQIGKKDSGTGSMGLGSARKVREFIYHPDEIKTLPTGKGIFLSRDTGNTAKISVRKPL